MVKNNVSRRAALGGMMGAAITPHVAAAAQGAFDHAVDPTEIKRIFVDLTLAEAEAATAEGQFFKLVDSTSGIATIYRRNAKGSDRLYDEATAAALASAEPGKGASLVGWRRSTDLAARNVDAKLHDLPVSIMDAEGADPSGTSDSTAAIQAAYDNAQVTGRALYIPDGRFLCEKLLLNNTITYTRSEKMMKICGPGTIVNTNTSSPMITADPASSHGVGLFIFKDMTFEDAEGAFALIDGDRVRRTIFDGVFFNRVARGVYAAAYIQSIYFTGCTIRGSGIGRWFVDVNSLFNVRFSGNIIEHRGNFLRTRSTTADPAVNSLVIENNLIEGLSGKAIELGACYATNITNNYFEGNTGGDLDCGKSTAFHKGLTIKGNAFQPYGDLLANADYYPIIWGKAATGGLNSGGNSSTGNLHDNSGTASMIDMTGDHASGRLYRGYASSKAVDRAPTGYAEYNDGPSKYLAVSDRLLRLDPFNRGIAYQGGAGYGSEVDGEIAPVWHMLGTANPGLAPRNYGERKWARGSYVWNAMPSELGEPGKRYIVKGWLCITAGQGGHSNGTDRWVEDRGLTGN